MTSSNLRPWNLRSQATSKPVNEAGMAHEESRVESKRGDSSRSLTASDRREFESTRFEDTGRADRQQIDTRREMSERSRVPERVTHKSEQLGGTGQKRDKVTQSYEPGGARPSHASHASGYAANQQYTSMRSAPYSYSQTPKYAYNDTSSENIQGYRRSVDDSYSRSPRYRKYSRSEEGRPSIRCPDPIASHQITENRRPRETLPRDYETVCRELEAKTRDLEERESRVIGLKAEISALQQRCEDQSAQLVSVRNELRSCQSQLDNVQRFVSTADTHADQDIIQKLQELNEEVYNISMTMADSVTEGLTRPSVIHRQKMARTVPTQDVSATIGDVLADYLAKMGPKEDIALFLQIAFQAYLSHFLYDIVTSWTIDQNLNALVEGTYQRLRKAETQAVSGRWRSLTRTHLLPTTTSNPDILVQHAMAVLSDIVVLAGLLPSQHDAASKLSSEFGKKIVSIVSHAEKFGGMMSEMISGDFEIFAVKPGETFNGENMVRMDMTEDKLRTARIVLCVSRVGLRKRVGEKTITITKAEVVLKSFLR